MNHTSYMKTMVLRRSNSEDIKAVWEGIRNLRIQKQTAVFEKLVKAIARERGIVEEEAKKMVLRVEHDGLIERCSNAQPLKSVNLSSPSFLNGPFTNEFFNLPDFSKPPLTKGPHDWNCFYCHLAGELVSCDECFRSYHINCYKELSSSSSFSSSLSRITPANFLCPSCHQKRDSEQQKQHLSRKQVRKLLDFATHFLRKKSIWKEMATIGYRGEIAKNELLVYKYMDLELLQRKMRDGRYRLLSELVDDGELFVHDVCILYDIFSDKADQARVLLREIRDEIGEVQLCPDCYINSKAKLAEWITKPCKPAHKLLWAKQTSGGAAGGGGAAGATGGVGAAGALNNNNNNNSNNSGGGQYYWPAKLLAERSDGFEVRFFGGAHDRAFVKKSDTKSFHFRPEEVEIKVGSGFDRAWNEVNKLREKIEQGYYTQSSGESDLPPSEDDYSDEIYLSERRASGLSLSDNHLANGSNYSLFSTLSSRRSLALEKTRKSVVSPSANGQVSSKKPTRSNIISKKSTKRTSSRAAGGPKAKRLLSNNSIEKSNSSYVRSDKSTPERSIKKGNKNSVPGTDSSDDSDNVSENSSSSVNMKSLNYKFSPKPTNIRSPIAAAKGLRQNRKQTTKMSQLSTGRYTSLSDRIKMDLSSTDSSEFDPKEERASYSKKRTKKTPSKYKVLSPPPINIPHNKSLINKPLKRSPAYKVLDIPYIKPEVPMFSQQHLAATTAATAALDSTGSSNEDTERCCSPDHLSTSPLFRSSAAVNQRLSRVNVTSQGYSTTGKRGGGVAAADSTSNNNNNNNNNNNSNNSSLVTTPLMVATPAATAAMSVTTTSPHYQQLHNNNNINNNNNCRQRINSGYNQPMFVNQAKRMVHKCVYTTMPVCNCQEKFDKKLEEEKQKLSKDHSQMILDLEAKLKVEYEEVKSAEIKKVSEEIRLQMQEIIDKEKAVSQEALLAAEARHNEALTNTKRRQWCRNCLKEAIYHCCWNTSYCSIQCQQEHWQKEHKRVCRRKR